MTLRTKLLLAQSPLLLGLVVLGVVGSVTISRLGRGSQRILHDNYRSVLAAQGMKEAVERIDSAAMFLVAGRPDKAAPQEAENRARFERDLRTQEENITEKGEREATARLRARWIDYQKRLDAFDALPDTATRQRVYFAELEPAFSSVKSAADEILGINEDAMSAKSDDALSTADRLDTLLLASTVTLLLLGFIASATFTTRLLRPLSVLTQALRRLGQGDTQARARLDGKDEVATLAREFNTMADRLEQYRKSSLGELLQAQAATQAAIDSLPDPVMLLTADGGLLSANQSAEALLSVTTDAAPFARTDPSVKEALDRVRAHVASGKGPYLPAGLDETIRLAAPSGDRHFLPRASPLYGESGQLVGVTVVLEEVTRILRFDELKNDLVATVAHEFRTPLTSLRMAIHLCTEEVVGPLTEKQADLLHAAREDCERLQTIVDDLLDLSRIQAGRLDLDRRPFPVADLLKNAGDNQRPRVAEKQLTLVLDVPPGLGEISVDADRFQLVLDNLLSNAIRHTPNGGRITMRARRDPAAVRVEITDGGQGIPRDYQSLIFEKFFRLPGAPTGGAGLGLYIAKEIVAAHGGAIGVVSDGEAGSTFWFTVPLALTTASS